MISLSLSPPPPPPPPPPQIITSVLEQDHFDISPHDGRIIEIKKNLLNIGVSVFMYY